MRILGVAAAGLLVFAVPSAATAQDASTHDAQALTELSEKLADPAFQEQSAIMGEALMQVLLDLPVGPMAEALNKATDGRSPAIDPDATVRDLAPKAEQLPGEVGENLPVAMTALSGMTEGMAAMLPALRNMAQRMKATMDSRTQKR